MQKKSWTGINTILSRQSKTKASDIFLNSNGNLFTDQKTVSKMFNNYYINVAGNLEKKIPKPKTKFQDYLKNPNEHSIYLKETTPAEVKAIGGGLKIFLCFNIFSSPGYVGPGTFYRIEKYCPIAEI